MSRLGDPGLQPQRTALAWSRTALAMLANALLVLRAGLQEEDPTVLALAGLVGLAAIALWGAGAWRRAALRRPDFRAVPSGLVAATAGGVLLAALAALWSFVASAA